MHIHPKQPVKIGASMYGSSDRGLLQIGICSVNSFCQAGTTRTFDTKGFYRSSSSSTLK